MTPKRFQSGAQAETPNSESLAIHKHSIPTIPVSQSISEDYDVDTIADGKNNLAISCIARVSIATTPARG